MRNGFLFVQITRCSNFAFWPRILQSIIFLRGRVLGNIFLYKIYFRSVIFIEHFKDMKKFPCNEVPYIYVYIFALWD